MKDSELQKIRDFYLKVEFNFPYNDENKATELLNEALNLNPDSVFCIIEEICRLPKSIEVSKKRRYDLLNNIKEKFEHPLKKTIFNLAEKYIEDIKLPGTDIIEVMEEIGRFPEMYNALNIAYYACDDMEGIIESKYDEIVSQWNKDNVNSGNI